MKGILFIFLLCILPFQKVIAQDKVENLVNVFTDWRKDTTTYKLERAAYSMYFHYLQNEDENEYFLNLSRNAIEKILGPPDEKKLSSFFYIIRESNIVNFDTYYHIVFIFNFDKVTDIRLKLFCG